MLANRRTAPDHNRHGPLWPLCGLLAVTIAAGLGATLLLGVIGGSPIISPAPARPAQAVFLALQESPQNANSSDWAGYATTGSTYHSVAGTWVEPTVTCSSGRNAYAAYWVGLDGVTSNPVEQIGTDSDCAQGSPSYYAWYELFPADPVQINKPVKPGDTLQGAVRSAGAGSVTLTLGDTTAKWTFSTTLSSSDLPLSSAEWIAEAPSNNRGTLPLADFGTVHFTHCAANGQSISANPNVLEITLRAFNGSAEAQPSSLSSDGTAFAVTWQQNAPPSPYPFHHHHHHHRHHWGWGGQRGQPPAPGGFPWPGGWSGW
jgi:hypothetical protein